MAILKRWSIFEQLIKATKYLWKPGSKTMDMEEWEGSPSKAGSGGLAGEPGGLLGQRQQFFYFLDECMKDAYVKGHNEGAEAALSLMGDEYVFDKSLDASCARHKWDKMEEEI